MKTRFTHKIRTLATALLLSTTAHYAAASASFNYVLSGGGSCSNGLVSPYCINGSTSWFGTMSLLTNSDADGTYGISDGGLTFAFASNLYNSLSSALWESWDYGSATLVGGQLVSLDIRDNRIGGGGGGTYHFEIKGLSALFDASNINGTTHATGVLSAVSPIPEPETYLMMALGLGLLAWKTRRRTNA